ncbi:MAG TPA: Ku protein [Acidimicrobiales bacterium]|nr:Ku protein [Acidimicrobiales bacterium]
MARAVFTGSISFGLVNVPVGLYSATHDETVHFNQFEQGTSDRIRYKRVNERTGEEVDRSDIVEGYPEGGGEYVIVTPDELDEVAPGRSRTIDISDFVDIRDIDPVTFKTTYYLAPDGEAAAKPYALLLRAMADAGRVGIATFVMRAKQHLAAIRPLGDVLALEVLWWADEVRDPHAELDLPEAQPFGDRELRMAGSLVESMTVPWDHTAYADTYRQRVLDLIEAKRQGRTVQTEPEPERGNVTDLMAALERSLQAAEQRRAGQRRAARPDAPGGDESPDDHLASLTKAELAARASELDVPGRSKMRRDELEQAVRRAEAAGRRKAS